MPDIKEAVYSQLAAQRENLILWMPVVLACGIGLYFGLKTEPSPVFGIGAVLVFAMVWALTWRGRNTGPGVFLWLAAGVLSLTALGFGLAQWRTQRVYTPMLEKPVKYAEVEGTIVSIDKMEGNRGSRVVLKDAKISKVEAGKTPVNIRLNIRKDAGLNPGDRISVAAGLNPPAPPAAPGAFDFQRHAYFQRIGAFGFSYKQPAVIAREKGGAGRAFLEKIRMKISSRLSAHMAPAESALAAAFMTGERAAMTEEDEQAMRASGLYHMISISGLHIGLVTVFVFFTTRFFMALFPVFALYHPIKKYAALLALLGAVAYMLLVGTSVPTLRSVLMTAIVLCAIVLDRVPFSMRLVAVAAAIILAFEPESLLSASFQMSFGAVAALVFFYEMTKEWWSGLQRGGGIVRRILIYPLGVCATTLVATLATAPFSMYHFQNLAVYSLVGNLLAMPLMAVAVMPAIVLGYFLMPLGVDAPALWVMERGIAAILYIAHEVEDFPLSMLHPPAWPLSALLAIVCAAVILMLTKGWLRAVSIVPLAIGFLLISLYDLPDVYVSSKGDLMAVRDERGRLHISSRVHDRFAAETWARQAGLEGTEMIPWPKSSDDLLKCDEQGCRAERAGRRVAFSFQPSALTEDCAWADVLISRTPVRKSCGAKIMIDRYDLWRDGAHAVWLDDARFESVGALRGKRPWTGPNGR